MPELDRIPVAAAMTRTSQVLEVLTLFSEKSPMLRASDICERLRVAPASAYRYIDDLSTRGLIEMAGRGSYVLGPSIVELDRHIRRTDPLIGAATPVMEKLAKETGGVILLCRIHGLKVLCVHQITGPMGPPHVSYERGRAMPLYRGATSKALLAHLPLATIEKMVRQDPQGLKQAKLPTDPKALFAYLQAQRANKVFTSVAEIDEDAMGWAAPILLARKLVGSLSIVLARKHGESRAADSRMADQVLRAALRIEGRIVS